MSSDASPPLVRALPYLQSAAETTLRLLFSIASNISSVIQRVAQSVSPVPILLYLLAPVFVFIQVVLDLTILLPLRTLSYFLDALRPLYVFVGVAIISGTLAGLAVRFFAVKLVELVEGSVKVELEVKAEIK